MDKRILALLTVGLLLSSGAAFLAVLDSDGSDAASGRNVSFSVRLDDFDWGYLDGVITNGGLGSTLTAWATSSSSMLAGYDLIWDDGSCSLIVKGKGFMAKTFHLNFTIRDDTGVLGDLSQFFVSCIITSDVMDFTLRLPPSPEPYYLFTDKEMGYQFYVDPFAITSTPDPIYYALPGSWFDVYEFSANSDVDYVVVNGPSWVLDTPYDTIAINPDSSVAPGIYDVGLEFHSLDGQVATQSFSVEVVEVLIFESVPTGGIIAIPGY